MRADSGTVPTREKTLSGEKERVDEATRATRADDSNLIEKSLTAAEMVRSTPARFARRPRRSIAGGKSRRTLFVCLARVLRKAIRFVSRRAVRRHTRGTRPTVSPAAFAPARHARRMISRPSHAYSLADQPRARVDGTSPSEVRLDRARTEP